MPRPPQFPHLSQGLRRGKLPPVPQRWERVSGPERRRGEQGLGSLCLQRVGGSRIPELPRETEEAPARLPLAVLPGAGPSPPCTSCPALLPEALGGQVVGVSTSCRPGDVSARRGPEACRRKPGPSGGRMSERRSQRGAGQRDTLEEERGAGMGCTWGQTPASVASPHPPPSPALGWRWQSQQPSPQPPWTLALTEDVIGPGGGHGGTWVFCRVGARSLEQCWSASQSGPGRLGTRPASRRQGPKTPTRQLCFPPSPQPRAKPPAQATQRLLDTNQNWGALVERVRLLWPQSPDLQHVRKSSHCAGPRGTPQGLRQRGSPWRARQNRGGHGLWSEADLGSHCCSQLKNIP
ncbi:uncharacterized protein LOC115802259 [Delphinapterus leucas]|uniref:Uncharacterized protein LOC115802259 n=1 Tax=Delphinapterus leucas TaxID=9749 RepID=A0A7F8K9P3_DELLE|nr:uncharacterized protein LOC115802259 [Delphinapterus leucas]XP_030616453.1 uncharacterized protein LOC115802259 [Delphinapterus leucas]